MTDNLLITPLDFVGINGYSDELTPYTRFSWRWHKGYRVVTLENGEKVERSGSLTVRPRDLLGVNDFAKELEREYFCWRWFDREHENFRGRFRFVTIEGKDHGGEVHIGTASILPQKLAVANIIIFLLLLTSSRERMDIPKTLMDIIFVGDG